MGRIAVAIGLGSNLGDRESHLAFARERLTDLLKNPRFSSVFETAPVGVPVPQAHFLNQAAVGETDLAPRVLLDRLLAIEQERGRERPFVGAPRTLDLDLLLAGDLIVHEPGLNLPHPRFRDRWFVLAPLAEIAPHLIDPVTRRPVGQLFEELSRRSPAGP